MSGDGSDVQKRTRPYLDQLESLLNEIKRLADSYERKAARLHRASTVSKALIAVLGVTAPALVTYQTQQANPIVAVLAIAITGIAGSATALQAAFRWGDGFGRASLTALALRRLARTIELQKVNAMETTDDLQRYFAIRKLVEEVTAEVDRIISQQIEAEVAVVSQPSAEQKPVAPVHDHAS